MRVLIAEDDRVSSRALEAALRRWGYEPVLARDGLRALELLRAPDGPSVALLDWMMPELDGLQVCARLREVPPPVPPYLLVITGRSSPGDVVKALEAGADDYVTKPFEPAELRARIRTGERLVKLQRTLADRVVELEAAFSRVKRLEGLLPICSYCKSVREGQNYWRQIESYVSDHSQARFSHGICPTCYATHVQPQLDEMRARLAAGAAPGDPGEAPSAGPAPSSPAEPSASGAPAPSAAGPAPPPAPGTTGPPAPDEPAPPARASTESTAATPRPSESSTPGARPAAVEGARSPGEATRWPPFSSGTVTRS